MKLRPGFFAIAMQSKHFFAPIFFSSRSWSSDIKFCSIRKTTIVFTTDRSMAFCKQLIVIVINRKKYCRSTTEKKSLKFVMCFCYRKIAVLTFPQYEKHWESFSTTTKFVYTWLNCLQFGKEVPGQLFPFHLISSVHFLKWPFCICRLCNDACPLSNVKDCLENFGWFYPRMSRVDLLCCRWNSIDIHYQMNLLEGYFYTLFDGLSESTESQQKLAHFTISKLEKYWNLKCYFKKFVSKSNLK